MRKGKKYLALLLAVLMMASMIPQSVMVSYAAEIAGNQTENIAKDFVEGDSSEGISGEGNEKNDIVNEEETKQNSEDSDNEDADTNKEDAEAEQEAADSDKEDAEAEQEAADSDQEDADSELKDKDNHEDVEELSTAEETEEYDVAIKYSTKNSSEEVTKYFSDKTEGDAIGQAFDFLSSDKNWRYANIYVKSGNQVLTKDYTINARSDESMTLSLYSGGTKDYWSQINAGNCSVIDFAGHNLSIGGDFNGIYFYGIILKNSAQTRANLKLDGSVRFEYRQETSSNVEKTVIDNIDLKIYTNDDKCQTFRQYSFVKTGSYTQTDSYGKDSKLTTVINGNVTIEGSPVFKGNWKILGDAGLESAVSQPTDSESYSLTISGDLYTESDSSLITAVVGGDVKNWITEPGREVEVNLLGNSYAYYRYSTLKEALDAINNFASTSGGKINFNIKVHGDQVLEEKTQLYYKGTNESYSGINLNGYNLSIKKGLETNLPISGKANNSEKKSTIYIADGADIKFAKPQNQTYGTNLSIRHAVLQFDSATANSTITGGWRSYGYSLSSIQVKNKDGSSVIPRIECTSGDLDIEYCDSPFTVKEMVFSEAGDNLYVSGAKLTVDNFTYKSGNFDSSVKSCCGGITVRNQYDTNYKYDPVTGKYLDSKIFYRSDFTVNNIYIDGEANSYGTPQFAFSVEAENDTDVTLGNVYENTLYLAVAIEKGNYYSTEPIDEADQKYGRLTLNGNLVISDKLKARNMPALHITKCITTQYGDRGQSGTTMERPVVNEGDEIADIGPNFQADVSLLCVREGGDYYDSKRHLLKNTAATKLIAGETYILKMDYTPEAPVKVIAEYSGTKTYNTLSEALKYLSSANADGPMTLKICDESVLGNGNITITTGKNLSKLTIETPSADFGVKGRTLTVNANRNLTLSFDKATNIQYSLITNNNVTLELPDRATVEKITANNIQLTYGGKASVGTLSVSNNLNTKGGVLVVSNGLTVNHLLNQCGTNAAKDGSILLHKNATMTVKGNTGAITPNTCIKISRIDPDTETVMDLQSDTPVFNASASIVLSGVKLVGASKEYVPYIENGKVYGGSVSVKLQGADGSQMAEFVNLKKALETITALKDKTKDYVIVLEENQTVSGNLTLPVNAKSITFKSNGETKSITVTGNLSSSAIALGFDGVNLKTTGTLNLTSDLKLVSGVVLQSDGAVVVGNISVDGYYGNDCYLIGPKDKITINGTVTALDTGRLAIGINGVDNLTSGTKLAKAINAQTSCDGVQIAGKGGASGNVIKSAGYLVYTEETPSVKLDFASGNHTYASTFASTKDAFAEIDSLKKKENYRVTLLKDITETAAITMPKAANVNTLTITGEKSIKKLSYSGAINLTAAETVFDNIAFEQKLADDFPGPVTLGLKNTKLTVRNTVTFNTPLNIVGGGAKSQINFEPDSSMRTITNNIDIGQYSNMYFIFGNLSGIGTVNIGSNQGLIVFPYTIYKGTKATQSNTAVSVMNLNVAGKMQISGSLNVTSKLTLEECSNMGFIAVREAFNVKDVVCKTDNMGLITTPDNKNVPRLKITGTVNTDPEGTGANNRINVAVIGHDNEESAMTEILLSAPKAEARQFRFATTNSSNDSIEPALEYNPGSNSGYTIIKKGNNMLLFSADKIKTGVYDESDDLLSYFPDWASAVSFINSQPNVKKGQTTEYTIKLMTDTDAGKLTLPNSSKVSILTIDSGVSEPRTLSFTNDIILSGNTIIKNVKLSPVTNQAVARQYNINLGSYSLTLDETTMPNTENDGIKNITGSGIGKKSQLYIKTLTAPNEGPLTVYGKMDKVDILRLYREDIRVVGSTNIGQLEVDGNAKIYETIQIVKGKPVPSITWVNESHNDSSILNIIVDNFAEVSSFVSTGLPIVNAPKTNSGVVSSDTRVIKRNKQIVLTTEDAPFSISYDGKLSNVTSWAEAVDEINNRAVKDDYIITVPDAKIMDAADFVQPKAANIKNYFAIGGPGRLTVNGDVKTSNLAVTNGKTLKVNGKLTTDYFSFVTEKYNSGNAVVETSGDFTVSKKLTSETEASYIRLPETKTLTANGTVIASGDRRIKLVRLDKYGVKLTPANGDTLLIMGAVFKNQFVPVNSDGNVVEEYKGSTKSGYVLAKLSTKEVKYYDAADISVSIRDDSNNVLGYFKTYSDAIKAIETINEKQQYTIKVESKDITEPLVTTAKASAIVVDTGAYTFNNTSDIVLKCNLQVNGTIKSATPKNVKLGTYSLTVDNGAEDLVFNKIEGDGNGKNNKSSLIVYGDNDSHASTTEITVIEKLDKVAYVKLDGADIKVTGKINLGVIESDSVSTITGKMNIDRRDDNVIISANGDITFAGIPDIDTSETNGLTIGFENLTPKLLKEIMDYNRWMKALDAKYLATSEIKCDPALGSNIKILKIGTGIYFDTAVEACFILEYGSKSSDFVWYSDAVTEINTLATKQDYTLVVIGDQSDYSPEPLTIPNAKNANSFTIKGIKRNSEDPDDFAKMTIKSTIKLNTNVRTENVYFIMDKANGTINLNGWNFTAVGSYPFSGDIKITGKGEFKVL